MKNRRVSHKRRIQKGGYVPIRFMIQGGLRNGQSVFLGQAGEEWFPMLDLLNAMRTDETWIPQLLPTQFIGIDETDADGDGQFTLLPGTGFTRRYGVHGKSTAKDHYLQFDTIQSAGIGKTWGINNRAIQRHQIGIVNKIYGSVLGFGGGAALGGAGAAAAPTGGAAGGNPPRPPAAAAAVAAVAAGGSGAVGGAGSAAAAEVAEPPPDLNVPGIRVFVKVNDAAPIVRRFPQGTRFGDIIGHFPGQRVEFRVMDIVRDELSPAIFQRVGGDPPTLCFYALEKAGPVGAETWSIYGRPLATANITRFLDHTLYGYEFDITNPTFGFIVQVGTEAGNTVFVDFGLSAEGITLESLYGRLHANYGGTDAILGKVCKIQTKGAEFVVYRPGLEETLVTDRGFLFEMRDDPDAPGTKNNLSFKILRAEGNLFFPTKGRAADGSLDNQFATAKLTRRVLAPVATMEAAKAKIDGFRKEARAWASITLNEEEKTQHFSPEALAAYSAAKTRLFAWHKERKLAGELRAIEGRTELRNRSGAVTRQAITPSKYVEDGMAAVIASIRDDLLPHWTRMLSEVLTAYGTHEFEQYQVDNGPPLSAEDEALVRRGGDATLLRELSIFQGEGHNHASWQELARAMIYNGSEPSQGNIDDQKETLKELFDKMKTRIIKIVTIRGTEVNVNVNTRQPVKDENRDKVTAEQIQDALREVDDERGRTISSLIGCPLQYLVPGASGVIPHDCSKPISPMALLMLLSTKRRDGAAYAPGLSDRFAMRLAFLRKTAIDQQSAAVTDAANRILGPLLAGQAAPRADRQLLRQLTIMRDEKAPDQQIGADPNQWPGDWYTGMCPTNGQVIAKAQGCRWMYLTEGDRAVSRTFRGNPQLASVITAQGPLPRPIKDFCMRCGRLGFGHAHVLNTNPVSVGRNMDEGCGSREETLVRAYILRQHIMMAARAGLDFDLTSSDPEIVRRKEAALLAMDRAAKQDPVTDPLFQAAKAALRASIGQPTKDLDDITYMIGSDHHERNLPVMVTPRRFGDWVETIEELSGKDTVPLVSIPGGCSLPPPSGRPRNRFANAGGAGNNGEGAPGGVGGGAAGPSPAELAALGLTPAEYAAQVAAYGAFAAQAAAGGGGGGGAAAAPGGGAGALGGRNRLLALQAAYVPGGGGGAGAAAAPGGGGGAGAAVLPGAGFRPGVFPGFQLIPPAAGALPGFQILPGGGARPAQRIGARNGLGLGYGGGLPPGGGGGGGGGGGFGAWAGGRRRQTRKQRRKLKKSSRKIRR